jgi:alpha/beta superfamily hydrolase
VLGGFSFGAYVASHGAAQLRRRATGRSAWCWSARRSSTSKSPPVPHDTPGRARRDRRRGAAGRPCFDWARPQALPVTVLPGAGHFFHGQLTVLKHIILRAWGVS